MKLSRSLSVARRARVQAFTSDGAYSQGHGRLPALHMSKHSHKNFAHALDSLVRAGKNWRELTTITGRHQTLFKALRRNHLVSAPFEVIAKKKFSNCTKITPLGIFPLRH